MKIKSIILAGMIPVFALTSCSVFNSASGQAVINAAVLVSVSHYVQSHPKDAAKVRMLADALDMLAGVLNDKLTREDFLSVVSAVDDSKDWQILGSALYDVYADQVHVPASAAQYGAVLHKLSDGLRLAVGPAPVVTK
jgi:hypothetical protein